MDQSSIVRQTNKGVEVDLAVTPNSGRSEVQGVEGWRRRLVVKLRAPPEKGEANAELEALLTDFFGARARVTKGRTSRKKTVTIDAEREKVLRALEVLDEGP